MVSGKIGGERRRRSEGNRRAVPATRVGILLGALEQGHLRGAPVEVHEISGEDVECVIKAEESDLLVVFVRQDGKERRRDVGEEHLAHQVGKIRPEDESGTEIGHGAECVDAADDVERAAIRGERRLLHGNREGGALGIRHLLPSRLPVDEVDVQVGIDGFRFEIHATDDDDRALVDGAARVGEREREARDVVRGLAGRVDGRLKTDGLRVEVALAFGEIVWNFRAAEDGAHVHDVDLLIDGDDGMAAGPASGVRRQEVGRKAESLDDVNAFSSDGVETVDLERELLVFEAVLIIFAGATAKDEKRRVDEHDGGIGSASGKRSVRAGICILLRIRRGPFVKVEI